MRRWHFRYPSGFLLLRHSGRASTRLWAIPTSGKPCAKQFGGIRSFPLVRWKVVRMRTSCGRQGARLDADLPVRRRGGTQDEFPLWARNSLNAAYVREVAAALGFTSTSEMITAIFERLCIGGFSGVVFANLGWQFSNMLAKKKVMAGYYLRPLPPASWGEPNEKDLTVISTRSKGRLRRKGHLASAD